MQVQKLSSVPSMCVQNKNNSLNSKKNIAFGWQLVVENGASNPKVTVKGSVLNNKGKKLFGISGFLKDKPEPFKNNEDYTSTLAKTLDVEDFLKRQKLSLKKQLDGIGLTKFENVKLNYKIEKINNKLDIWQKKVLQNSKERKLKSLAVLLPGTIQNNKAIYIPNIKRYKMPNEVTNDTENKVRLTNVNLPEVISNAKQNKNVKIAKNIKFIAAKDLAGTGFGVFERFANNPKYSHYVKDGLVMTVIHPGGGYGAVDVKVKGKLVNIETNERGHAYFHNIMTGEEERLGGMGASVPKVLSNFAEKIGITQKEDVDAIKATGLGQLATETEVRLNNVSCRKAIDLLLKTGVYENGGIGPYNTLLKVKDNQMERFLNASKFVIDSYANNLAVAAISKISESSNLIVLSGPMTMGMNGVIENNPNIYGAKNLRDLTFKFIDKNSKNDSTINDNIKIYGFDIICDSDISIKDNTRGGEMLLKDHIITHPNRGQWIEVPLSVFNKKRSELPKGETINYLHNNAKRILSKLSNLFKKLK